MRVTQLIARGLLCPLFTLTALVASAETMKMAIEVKFHDVQDDRGNVSPMSAEISSGTTSFTATPNPGYKFSYWSTSPEYIDYPMVYPAGNRSATITVAYDMTVANVELRPVFVYGQYTVTLDPRGETIGGASTMAVTNNQKYANLPTPDWPGHVFKGWFDGNTQIKNGDSIWLTNDTTFCANWTTNSYKLTITRGAGISRIYYRKGGDKTYLSSTGDVSVDVLCGTAFSWYAEAATGYKTEHMSEQTAVNGTMLVDGVSYTATATPQTYTVTFDANGGTCSEVSRQVQYDAAIGTLPVATWGSRAYEFDGWSTSTYGSGRVSESTKCTGDITLYARWVERPHGTIKLIAEPDEGGKVSGAGSYYLGETATLTATPAVGYSFSQWHDGALSAERKIEVVTTGEFTYRATFTGNVYRVVFDANADDAFAEPSSKDVTFGAVYGALAEATRPGYRLLGWFTGKEGGSKIIPSETRVSTTGDEGVITLFAHWQKIPVFFVAFDGNGATDGLMATQTVECSVWTVLSSNAFSRTGYTFDGWTNATGRAYADGASVYNLAEEDATATLYAKWTPNKYHVVFDSNGQRGTMSPVSNCTYDVAFNLPENKFVNLTGEFLGWTTNKTATAAEWTDKASVMNLTTDGTVTLYAVWRSLINELTKAAHGKNVVLTTAGKNLFTVYTDDTSYTSVKSGQRSDEDIGYPYRFGSWLELTVKGPGTLTYRYRFSRTPQSGYITYIVDGTFVDLSGTLGADGWYQVSKTFVGGAATAHTVQWASSSSSADDFLLVDRVVWMPEGDVVEPTEENAPTIGEFEPTADGFSLSFPSDDRFDYRVLSTTSLAAPIDWKPDEKLRLEGTGGTLTFQIPVGEGTDPARFFKVEVLPREAK